MNKFKKIFGLFVVVITILCMGTTAMAASVGVVTTNSGGKVMVRKTPDENGAIVKALTSGTTVTVESQTGDWYKISTASVSGYMKCDYVLLTDAKVEDKVDNTQVVVKEGQFPKWGIITTESLPLRLREYPDINSRVLTGMAKGASVTVLSGECTVQNANGQTYQWYNIQYGTYVGYACLNESSAGYNYITITGSTTTTETQEKTVSGWIRTNGSNLYVRNSPEYTNNKIGLVANGVEVKVTGNPVNGFYKISGTLTNGKSASGYACADYITFTKPNNVGGYTSTTGGGKTLNVISYKQYNYPNDYVGNSTKSIKSVGCFVTSMAMVHSYNTGTTYTPVTIQKKLSFTGASFYHSSVTNLGYTMKKNSDKSSSYNIEMLKAVYNSIQNGRPAIVCVSTSGGSTHYVAVTGYDGNPSNLTAYNFIINDPGSSKNTRLSQPLAGKPIITQAIY